jgi:Cof subfamily protein (haloacid dehalogenase superfamily)
MVRHAVTREILHEITVPVPLADEVLAFARQHGISAVGYHRTGIYFETDTEWMRLDEKRSGQPARQGDLNELARDGLQKVMYAAAKPDIDRLYERMAEEYGSRLYVVHTENELMEFLSPEANKARGAETVMRKLGLSVGQIVAFGDGNNDVPVLSWAGMSVAMNHGRESARLAAKRVTPPGPMEEAFARGVELVLGKA